MKIKFSPLLLLLIIFTSCTNKRLYVYSPDRTQCITIITEQNTRYLIDGKHYFVPKNNYVKLDITGIDSESDAIAGCWKNEKYKWLIINDKVKIIENKLDTLYFKFDTNFPEDERGIPTLKDFIGNGCYNFDFQLLSIVPKGGAIIE